MSSNHNPTVSVIIPTYNDADVLPRSLESALGQTFDDIEIIVVNDGSTDHTREVLDTYSDPRLHVIHHEENRGGSAARNTGIDQSRGTYIAFLDSDDEWLPQKLARQVERIETLSDNYVAVHCWREYKRPRLGRLRVSIENLLGFAEEPDQQAGGEELIPLILTMQLSTGASTLLVKQETVDRIGGFDSTFPRHQDWEFLIRVLKEGKLGFVDEVLVRKHLTGEPSPSTFKAGKSRLFEKFADEIMALEEAGHPITEIQDFHLAKIYVEKGSFRKGLRIMLGQPFTPKRVLSGVWSVFAGLRHILSSN